MSATMKGRTLIPTLGDALCQAYPIGEGVNSADSLEVHLPSWLTDNERQAILEECRRFVAARVEAARR